MTELEQLIINTGICITIIGSCDAMRIRVDVPNESTRDYRTFEDVIKFLRERATPIRAEQRRIAAKLAIEFYNPARFGIPVREALSDIARELAEGKY